MNSYFQAQGKFPWSSNQIHHLSKKLLCNYYDQQIRNKNIQTRQSKRQNSLNGLKKPIEKPQNQLTYFQMNRLIQEKQRAMKKQLGEEYQKALQLKQLKRIQLKQQQKRCNEIAIQNFKTIGQRQKQQQNRNLQIYTNNEKQLLNMVERIKLEKYQAKSQEKQQYNKRLGTIHKSKSIGQMMQKSKLSYFKQHYDKVNEMQKIIQNDYVKNWSPKIQQKQKQKDRLVNFQNPVSPITPVIQNRKIEAELRNNIKTSLIQQILQKQRLRNQQLKEKRNYIKVQNPENQYHPICNPINYRIAHDNKYILNELKRQKEQRENSPVLSGLARNGSFSLISK